MCGHGWAGVQFKRKMSGSALHGAIRFWGLLVDLAYESGAGRQGTLTEGLFGEAVEIYALNLLTSPTHHKPQ